MIADEGDPPLAAHLLRVAGAALPVGFIWTWSPCAARCPSHRADDRRDTPFCFLAIPMMIVPAALHEDARLPGLDPADPSNPHAVHHDRPVARGHVVLGKGGAPTLLLRRDRGGLLRAGEEAAPPPGDPAGAGAWAVLAAVVLLSPDLGRRLLHVALSLQGGHRVPRGALPRRRGPGGIFGSLFIARCWCSRSDQSCAPSARSSVRSVRSRRSRTSSACSRSAWTVRSAPTASPAAAPVPPWCWTRGP